jgi:hypothetical protein
MNEDLTITMDTMVVASPQQVSADLSGEVAILNLDSGVYYGLNVVGAFIWNLIQEPTRVREIYEAVLGEFDVDHEQCQNDVDRLLRKLADESLIEIENENAG